MPYIYIFLNSKNAFKKLEESFLKLLKTTPDQQQICSLDHQVKSFLQLIQVLAKRSVKLLKHHLLMSTMLLPLLNMHLNMENGQNTLTKIEDHL
jgi:hypothetical protein